MIIDQLLGLEFDIEKRNCYTLARDFYRLNYDIELSDYACPTDWWENGLDIYGTLPLQEGFKVLHAPPHEWVPGDIIMMAIGASVANHIGILVEGGKMLHHLRGQRSAVTRYGSIYRNTTVGVYRHPLAQNSPLLETVDILDALPQRLAKKLAHSRSL